MSGESAATRLLHVQERNQQRRRTSAPCRAAASTLGICLLYVQNSQVNQSTNPTPITTTKPPLGRRPPSTQPNQLATASIDRHTHQPPHGTSQKKGDRTTITCPADCRAHPLGTGTPTKVQLTARSSIPGRWSGSPVPCTSSGAKRGGTAYRKAAGGFGACRSRRWCGPVEREGLTPPTHRDRLGRNWLLLL